MHICLTTQKKLRILSLYLSPINKEIARGCEHQTKIPYSISTLVLLANEHLTKQSAHIKRVGVQAEGRVGTVYCTEGEDYRERGIFQYWPFK